MRIAEGTGEGLRTPAANRWRWLRGALVVVALLTPARPVSAELEAAPQRVSPLGLEQQRLGEKLRRLEDELQRVRAALADQNDPRVEVLDRAMAFAKEKLIEANMRTAAGELHADAYAQVEQTLAAVIRDLALLLQILDNQDDEFERLRKREEQLKAWMERLTKMGREEWQALQDSLAADQKDRLAELDRHLAAARELLKQQVDLREETQAASEAGVFDFAALGDRQKHLRRKTKRLAEGMKSESPVQNSPVRPDPPGVEALFKASAEQQQAERMLAAGSPAEGLQDQADAIEQLRHAIAAMEQERARAAGLSEASMQANQEQIEQTAADVKEQMREAEQVSGEAQPGLEQMMAAKALMGSAASALGNAQMEVAAEDQRDAHRQIEDALEQVKKELEALQEDKREALKEKILEQLRDMLSQHLPLVEMTESLRAIREQGAWNLGHDASLRRVRAVEQEVLGQGREILAWLAEDGTGGIVSNVLADVNHELDDVVGRLSRTDVSARTQLLQVEISESLEDLLAVLGGEFAPSSDLPPPDDQPPPSDGRAPPPPLYGKGEQLAIVRMQQARLNSKVEQLAAEGGDGPLSADARFEAQRCAETQADILNLARELAR
jgi:DNA repair exonuclease SbcCD ATPase subunit